MASVEEAAQRVTKRVGEKDVSSDLGLVCALDDLAEAVEKGSQPECARVQQHVVKAAVDVLKRGTSMGTAQSLNKVLYHLWNWLDTSAMTAGHQTLLEVVSSGTSTPSILIPCCHVITAVYSSVDERGHAGTIGFKHLDALTAVLPSIDKLPDWTSRIAIIDTITACLSVACPTSQTLRSDHKCFKQCLKAVKDKDPNVRTAGYKCIGYAAAYSDTLTESCYKGLSDLHPGARAAAAEALARILHSGFERHKTGRAVSKKSLMGSKKKAVNGLSQGLLHLRTHFTPPATMREAASATASLFLQRCGQIAVATCQEMTAQLLSFLSIGANGKNPLAGATDVECRHAARCIGAAISSWAGACGSEQARIVILKELLTKISAKPADRDKFDPVVNACIYCLPDLMMQLEHAAAEHLHADVSAALLTCGAATNVMRLRVDCALAMRTLSALVPSLHDTDCQLLISKLIHHSGNALCSVGTPCDHDAIRHMFSAATCLLSILPHDSLAANQSMKLQLTELCSVAFPEPPYTASVDPSKKGKNTVPVDPQAKLELACLLETCLACSSGAKGLKNTLGPLTQKLSMVLKGREIPASAKDAYYVFRSRSSALLAVVSVLRFAHASGYDVALLASGLHAEFLPSLEDTFEVLYHKSIAWSDDKIEGALCTARLLAYDAVRMLPQVASSSSLYAVVMKASVGTISVLSQLQVATTLLPSQLQDALPTLMTPPHALIPDVLSPVDSIDFTPCEVSDWHEAVCYPVVPNEGPLMYERWRLPVLTLLLNNCIACFGTIFARQGRANKRSVMDKMRQNLAATVDKTNKVNPKQKKAQLNIASAMLAALAAASKHHSCRDIFWNTDKELKQIVTHAIASAKLLIPSQCHLTRCAGSEIIGLASGLAGKMEDPIDTFLANNLAKAKGTTAAALAQCMGALHAHDPQGRADILSLSFSYLMKLARCGDAAQKSKTTDPVVSCIPFVMTALARVAESAGQSIAGCAHVAMSVAAEKIITKVQAGGETSDVDSETAYMLTLGRVVKGVVHSLGVELDPASKMAKISRTILLQGLGSRNRQVRTEFREVLSHLILTGAVKKLRVNVSEMLTEAINELNSLDTPQGDALVTKDFKVLCELTQVICRDDSENAAHELGPRHLFHLIDAVGSRQGDLTSTLYQSAEVILKNTSTQLVKCSADEQTRARAIEWVEEVEKQLTYKSRIEDDSPREVRDEDEEDEEDSTTVTPVESPVAEKPQSRMVTKAAAMKLLCTLFKDLQQCDQAGRWLLKYLDRVLKICLVAADDEQCAVLCSHGLLCLESVVCLFKDVKDPHTACYNDDTLDPVFRQNSVLVNYQAQLTSSVRQGLDAANTGAVRAAAASLAAQMINCHIMPVGSVSKLFVFLASRYNEHTSDDTAKLGLVSGVCKVVEAATQLQATRVDGGMAELAADKSLPLAVLNMVNEGGPKESSTVDLQELRAKAADMLRQLGILTGMMSGWVLADKTRQVPSVALLPYYKAEAYSLLCVASSDTTQGDLVTGLAVQMLQDVGKGKVGSILAAVQRSLENGVTAGQRTGALAYVLHERSTSVSAAEHARLVQCLVLLLNQSQQQAVSADVRAILSRTAAALLNRCDACFASFAGTTQLPVDSPCAPAVSCMRSLMQAGSTFVPFFFEAIRRALTSASQELQLASKACAIDMLRDCCTAEQSADSIECLQAFVHSFQSTPPTGASSWCVLGAAHMALVAATRKSSRMLETCATQVITRGAGVQAAVEGLAAAVQVGKEDGFQKGAKDLCLLGVSIGGAVVAGDGADGQSVTGGAKLLFTSVLALQSCYLDEADMQPVVSAAVAALSTGAARNAAMAVPLGRCLIELVQRFQVMFKGLMPSLSQEKVAQLRAQMSAAQSQQQPQQVQQAAARPGPLSINARAFSGPSN